MKLAWKRYPVWLGILWIEIFMVWYLLLEMKSWGGAGASPDQFLRMGLYVGSYALPAGALGIYGILWMEDFSKRRAEVTISCGIGRQTFYRGKSLFGLLWMFFTVILIAVGLWLGGVIAGEGVPTKQGLFSALPILQVYLGMAVLLNALCSFLGILLRKRREGLLLFGIVLFLWDRWRLLFGEERIYQIVFARDGTMAWILTGILTVLACCLYLAGGVLAERLDFR